MSYHTEPQMNCALSVVTATKIEIRFLIVECKWLHLLLTLFVLYGL